MWTRLKNLSTGMNNVRHYYCTNQQGESQFMEWNATNFTGMWQKSLPAEDKKISTNKPQELLEQQFQNKIGFSMWMMKLELASRCRLSCSKRAESCCYAITMQNIDVARCVEVVATVQTLNASMHSIFKSNCWIYWTSVEKQLGLSKGGEVPLDRGVLVLQAVHYGSPVALHCIMVCPHYLLKRGHGNISAHRTVENKTFHYHNKAVKRSTPRSVRLRV